MSLGFNPATAFRLDDRPCVVTGGASGIGRAVAVGLGRAGAHVHLLDRDAVTLAETVAALTAEGLAVFGHPGDVTDQGSVAAVFEAVARQSGPIYGLVNNAGIAIRRPAVELAQADWQRVMDVNLTGVFLCARTAARQMIGAGRGAIVNMTSIMGLSGGGLYPNISYQTSKGAVVNLTRALAIEWAPHGVRVNAVAPTWVRTDFIRPLLDNPELVARMQAVTPLGRVAEPEEIVGAVLFLLSGAAAMVTGHTLPVDGGFLAQ